MYYLPATFGDDKSSGPEVQKFLFYSAYTRTYICAEWLNALLVPVTMST